MSWCSWGWCWRSINTDHDWSRWSDWPPGCLVSARCGSSASARLFIEVVGSPTWCCHHHVAICFRLWDRCKPAELVVVGLVDVWHGGECHIGCAGRHGNQVTVKCVACGKTSVELMFHPPAESPERRASWRHVHGCSWDRCRTMDPAGDGCLWIAGLCDKWFVEASKSIWGDHPQVSEGTRGAMFPRSVFHVST